MWQATVLTLFPAMFPGSLGLSLAGDALARGLWSLETRDIRDHGLGRHRTVDDRPAGGGAGMVLRADVVAAALDAALAFDDPRPRLVMSPRGVPLSQARARDLAAGPGVAILCGRFEGFDERVFAARGLTEVSIGDYVLSGGEPGALVLLDACVRLLPGCDGRGRIRTRGELRERPSRISALYPPAGVRGSRHPRRATRGRSPEDRRLAAGTLRGADTAAPARPAPGNPRTKTHERTIRAALCSALHLRRKRGEGPHGPS